MGTPAYPWGYTVARWEVLPVGLSGIGIVNITLEGFAFVLVLVLILSISRENMAKNRRILMQAMWLHAYTLLGGLAAMSFLGSQGMLASVAVHVGAFVYFLFSILTCVVVLFYLYANSSPEPIANLRSDYVVLAMLTINGLNMLGVLSNPLTHAYYAIGPDNVFVWGPLHRLHNFLFLLQTLLSIFIVLRLRHQHSRMTVVRLLLCGVVASLSVACELAYPELVLLPSAVSLILVLMSVGVQARLEEDLAKARTEVVESRIRLLSGQIHPHFIFNSLNAIKALVVEDPELAERTIQDFSDYLRSHLDEMSSSRLVPFTEELSHVRHYVSLEQADITRPLEVRYELEVQDFFVPPLTVQPLVENAIRHGIRTREEGGTVVIATRRTKGAVQVLVSDDGHGLSSATERQHQRRQVGIENVRERLERQCNGTLEVTSGPAGTVATMTLPEGGIE